MKRKTQLLVLYKINSYCGVIKLISYIEMKSRVALMPPQQYNLSQTKTLIDQFLTVDWSIRH